MLLYVRRIVELPRRVAVRRTAEFVRFRARGLLKKIQENWAVNPLEEEAFSRRLGIEGCQRDVLAEHLFCSSDSTLPIRWVAVPETPGLIEAVQRIASDAVDHRFDLLGSGPVQVDYNLSAPGVEGNRYAMAPGPLASKEQRLRMELLLPGSSLDYSPIDWHTDFKSGYRWNPEAWYLDLRYGNRSGMDVKVPWDLSRLQHVGALGLVYRLDPGGPEGARAASEFRSQVVDWIAANPLRRGVNWLCTMDVAIRAVNWLIGLALFEDAPELTPEFRWLIAKSLYAHALHIESNLEYSATSAGNHYLANVVGLLCIAAALPALPESDRWLLWGIQEMVSEMRRQVLPDGADFEGSTGYHFLVAEMFYLGTAVVLKIPLERRERLCEVGAARMPHPTAPPLRPYSEQEVNAGCPEFFPDWYLDRLLAMAEYGADLVKPNGLIPLVGDHDSGRMYKLSPSLRPAPGGGYEEEHRDYRRLAALGGRLFDRADLASLETPFRVDTELILAEIDAAPIAAAATRWRAGDQDPTLRRYGMADQPTGALSAYPCAGIFIARTSRIYMAVTCGRVPTGGSGGHYHNDLLSFELNWDGMDFVVDGGSYLYTPAPEHRNAFRSVQAHSTVAVEGTEQRIWPASPKHLFSVLEDATVKVLEARPGLISSECRYGGIRHERTWTWREGSVRLDDVLEGARGAVLVFNLAPGVDAVSIEPTGADSHELRLRNGPVSLALKLDGVAAPQIAKGYYSPGYGERSPNIRLLAPIVGRPVSSLFSLT